MRNATSTSLLNVSWGGHEFYLTCNRAHVKIGHTLKLWAWLSIGRWFRRDVKRSKQCALRHSCDSVGMWCLFRYMFLKIICSSKRNGSRIHFDWSDMSCPSVFLHSTHTISLNATWKDPKWKQRAVYFRRVLYPSPSNHSLSRLLLHTFPFSCLLLHALTLLLSPINNPYYTHSAWNSGQKDVAIRVFDITVTFYFFASF